ncbi:hypothetical protein [uncultured Desulfosarcina sp.]|uniref:hypothetical protein n=1 Tax=uncultured Desulfosarcina sp. TaxID=218289 RepID=UPI0029C621C6|nr:hypothetical protein [uncultured Desulfosarcina sp.]
MSELSNPHWFAGGTRRGMKLDKSHVPTAFYEDRKQAEDELFRLSEKGEGFALFELAGYVVESQVTVRACHIERPDDIPF